MALWIACISLVLGFASAQPSINCNLRNGAGCNSYNPYFLLTYQNTNPGPSTECRLAYNLRVYVTAPYSGFECSFVTDGYPQPNTQRYSISHNNIKFWETNTAYVDVYGNDVYKEPEYSSNPKYYDNWMYIPNAHASTGYSFANYRFENRRLEFYSDNTGVHYQLGHPRGFRPVNQYTFIGLNKVYEHNSFGGYGLCQVFCQLVMPRPVALSSASSNSERGASPNIPSVPSRPPPPPEEPVQDAST